MNKRAVILCLLVNLSFTVQGQPGPWRTVFAGPITLDSLTHFMNIHSDIRLTFNSSKIKGTRAVLFSGKTYDLNGLLGHIQKSTGLSYLFYRNHVIFRDDPHKATVSKVHKKPAAGPIGKSAVARKPSLAGKSASTTSELHVVLAKADTAKREMVRIDTGLRKKTVIVLRKSIPQEVNNSEPKAAKWLLRAGLFANEVLYVNAGMEAGIKPIYLIFSAGSNFHVSGWHIGLGATAFTLSDVPIHITAGYSSLNTSITLDSGQRSSNITVKGQLYDLGISGTIQEGRHWGFKAGISWNLLRTNYNEDGIPVAPGKYNYTGQNLDKLLYLLRPPLKVVNTFNVNSSGNIKMWPGISVGFFYDFLK